MGRAPYNFAKACDGYLFKVPMSRLQRLDNWTHSHVHWSCQPLNSSSDGTQLCQCDPIPEIGPKVGGGCFEGRSFTKLWY